MIDFKFIETQKVKNSRNMIFYQGTQSLIAVSQSRTLKSVDTVNTCSKHTQRKYKLQEKSDEEDEHACVFFHCQLLVITMWYT